MMGIGGATTLSHGLGNRGETACPAISVTYKGERMGTGGLGLPGAWIPGRGVGMTEEGVPGSPLIRSWGPFQ